VLDLNQNQALGYVNDAILNQRMGSLKYDRFLGGPMDCSNLPPHDYVDLLREQVMPVAPNGMTNVHLSDTSTAANDAAIGVALFNYAMKHKKPYQNLVVMGLGGASHGDSISAMSCSDPIFNKGLPTFDWPQAPLPHMIQPFIENTAANAQEEQRCIDAAAQIIENQRAAGKDVGAIIVEPIAGHANLQAAPTYYKRLRQLAAREGIPFIVDETEIGIGRSAKMWSHEYWYLSENDGGCADIMTFGGNTGLSGFYSTLDYRVDPMCCNFDQNINMVNVVNFGVTW
jgi:4-aminobutyrate aminotransferase/(S)-3-amino-2-methylpropionate transaminase